MVSIFKAFLTLKTEQECEQFLKDLCTPKELRAFQERWQIAQLLYAGNKSYREIADETKASITTVTRVARFLKDEPYQGYNLVLKRV